MWLYYLKRSKNLQYTSPTAVQKELVRPRSLASTHARSLVRACTLRTKTNLMGSSELGLPPRVADRCAWTRWPWHATFVVRRLSRPSSCTQVLPDSLISGHSTNSAGVNEKAMGVGRRRCALGLCLDQTPDFRSCRHPCGPVNGFAARVDNMSALVMLALSSRKARLRISRNGVNISTSERFPFHYITILNIIF